MQKTKLGISVGLVAALIYFAGYFSGILAMVVIGGYVFIAEDDEWLKRTTAKAIVLSLSLSLLSAVIGLIPDAIGLINDLLVIFDDSFYLPKVNSFINLLNSVISITKTVLFVVLGVKALKQQTIRVPFVDDFVNTYMN